jgi:hypothetical protein
MKKKKNDLKPKAHNRKLTTAELIISIVKSVISILSNKIKSLRK